MLSCLLIASTKYRCKRTVSLGFLASILTACASPYVAYEGVDAAKLRVSQTAALSRSYANVALMDESGQCGQWFQLQLNISEQTGALRADMPDSAPESDRNQAEVSLQPGTYAIRLQGELYPRVCSTQLKLNLTPQQLYWVEIAGLLDECQFKFMQNKPILGGGTAWQAMPANELQAMDYDEIRESYCRLGN